MLSRTWSDGRNPAVKREYVSCRQSRTEEIGYQINGVTEDVQVPCGLNWSSYHQRYINCTLSLKASISNHPSPLSPSTAAWNSPHSLHLTRLSLFSLASRSLTFSSRARMDTTDWDSVFQYVSEPLDLEFTSDKVPVERQDRVLDSHQGASSQVPTPPVCFIHPHCGVLS
jgi:hypothetical protein